MESVFGALKGFGALRAIAAMLGMSMLGVLGIVALVRTAMAQIFGAVESTKQFVSKVEMLITSPELKQEFQMLKIKWDHALEALADIAGKMGMKDWERRLRDAL